LAKLEEHLIFKHSTLYFTCKQTTFDRKKKIIVPYRTKVRTSHLKK